jgi:hypothetical protein
MVTLSAPNSFNGMIYPKGLSKNSTCMVEYTSVSNISYKLPLRSCNTMSTDVVSFFSFLSSSLPILISYVSYEYLYHIFLINTHIICFLSILKSYFSFQYSYMFLLSIFYTISRLSLHNLTIIVLILQCM